MWCLNKVGKFCEPFGSKIVGYQKQKKKKIHYLGTRRFCIYFWEVDHPLCMWCLNKVGKFCEHFNQKLYGTKNKKWSIIGTRGFCTYFWEVDHPLHMGCLNECKICILIGAQDFEKLKIYKSTLPKPPNVRDLRSLKFWIVLVLRWVKIEHTLLVIQRTICRHIVG